MDEISLVSLKPKESGRVKEVLGGSCAKKRLYELGLNKGAEIVMVKNDIGPVIVYLSGCKLALGRGLASNVIIER